MSKYDNLFSKVSELEGLAGIFQAYYMNKADEGISQNDFELHMNFFVNSFIEKIEQLYSILESEYEKWGMD